MASTTHAASSDAQLAAIFRGGRESPGDEALGALLRRLFEEGEHAWPGIALAPEAFVLHLGARSLQGEPPSAERAPDLYLACACVEQVRGAHEAFERAHLGRVGAYLARMRPSPAFVDDVRQSLREKLLMRRDGHPPRIAEYDGRGALASWMRVIALRAAIDLRRRTPEAAPELSHGEEPATAELENDYLKQRYREAFNAAFRGAVAALSDEQREILRLHFVDGLTLDQLATMARVHRATVARRLAAAREAVADETRRLVQIALGATADELASLTGLMRSQIDVSLPGLLQPSAHTEKA